MDEPQKTWSKLAVKAGMIRYVDQGKGPALLYIHGLGSSGILDYPPVFPHIPHCRHVVPDLLGFGFSDKPQDYGYSLIEQANSLVEFLNLLNLDLVSLVGHSMGGAIALALYRLIPDRIQALIICEGNLKSGGGFISRPIVKNYTEEGFVQNYAQWAAQYQGTTNKGKMLPSQKQFARTLDLADPRAVYCSAQALVAPFPGGDQLFEQASVPRAWISGTRMLDTAELNRLAQLPIATYVIPEAGHAMMLDAPLEFGQAIHGFLLQAGIAQSGIKVLEDSVTGVIYE